MNRVLCKNTNVRLNHRQKHSFYQDGGLDDSRNMVNSYKHLHSMKTNEHKNDKFWKILWSKYEWVKFLAQKNSTPMVLWILVAQKMGMSLCYHLLCWVQNISQNLCIHGDFIFCIDGIWSRICQRMILILKYSP